MFICSVNELRTKETWGWRGGDSAGKRTQVRYLALTCNSTYRGSDAYDIHRHMKVHMHLEAFSTKGPLMWGQGTLKWIAGTKEFIRRVINAMERQT